MRPRYRFGEFTLAPSRRLLLHGGRETALIPRYFDLLVLLVERRGEAVHRRDILDAVWSDVVVSDGALTQAVRVLRRTLGDDPREPRYIRTVSRHGYRFVHDVVTEREDVASPASPRTDALPPPVAPPGTSVADPFEQALACLVAEPSGGGEDEESARREAAETLHALGIAEALRRLDRRPGHERARAWLREVRWDLPAAGPVPILGHPGSVATARILMALRLRHALRLSGRRWAAAAAGGAGAGLVAGLLGGMALLLGPGSDARATLLVALSIVGMAIGGLGAAGVGAGLAAAEALFRSLRRAALVLLGALGGGAIGAAAHFVGLWTVQGLFGRDLSPVAGGLEGLVIGGAAGLGYALGTPTAEGGMATPRGRARFRVAALTGACCAAACIGLTWTGSYLGAMSLDLVAHRFPGSEVSLAPLSRLLGEAGPGGVTRTVIAAWEGLMFGFGLALGLTHRPRASSS